MNSGVMRTEKRPFERYRWCENNFYDEANYDKTISKEELTKQIEDIASILKDHGFDAASAPRTPATSAGASR